MSSFEVRRPHHPSSEQPSIPPDEYPARRQRLAEQVRSLGYRGVIVWSRGGGTYDNFGDVLYLTNHYGPFPWINDKQPLWAGRGQSAVVITADSESILCVEVPDWRTDLVHGSHACICLPLSRK